MNRLKRTILSAAVLAVVARADHFGEGRNLFAMDFATIGSAGNAGDARYAVNGINPGSVSYNYRIGVHEVTIDQFFKVRNMDGRVGDGDEDYWNDGVSTVGVHAPVGYVSWFEAARFCNWLTSGDAYTGAYLFNGNGGLTNVNRAAALSTYGTIYVLPTEDEWYKAAYYKPVNDGSYSLYASGLDSTPIFGTTNGWNYYDNGYVVGVPDFVWPTGYGGVEQNGTYDMNGNAWEWMESALDGLLDDVTEKRVYRGGAYQATATYMLASERSGVFPTNEFASVGFRVASLAAVGTPVPSTSVGISQAVEIDWPSVLGETYQVQYSTNLASGSWMNLGETVTGDGSGKSAFDSTRIDEQRFYQVITH